PVPESHPDPLSLWERVALRPQGVLADPLEHVDHSDDRERVAADAAISFDYCVVQAHLDRVEPELPGELVEQRLQCEGGGRGSGRTVRAEREGVRLHATATESGGPT